MVLLEVFVWKYLVLMHVTLGQSNLLMKPREAGLYSSQHVFCLFLFCFIVFNKKQYSCSAILLMSHTTPPSHPVA